MKIKKSLTSDIILLIVKQKLPLCQCGCGKPVSKPGIRFRAGHNGRYNKGRKATEESKRKRKNTCKLKYGVENIFKSKEVREKIKHVLLKKYGVEHPGQSEKVKEKSRQTCLKKHGTEYSFQSEETKEKIKQTMLEKHGVENPNQSEKIKEKKKQTNLKKHGVDNPFKSEKIKEQIKQTNLDIYGYEYISQSDEIKEKSKQTCLKNCGFDNWRKTIQGRQLARINFIKMIECQKLNGEPLSPRIGNCERTVLDELQQHTQYNIIRNDHSIADLIGFFPDGHIPELKLFIEFDERNHFMGDNITYIQRDIDRELELASLGYIIFRVSEKDWKENKEKVINQFKDLL